MSVPKLDLAPKLKRPLSLWTPLDYLRLLYWVFYFPQALRWYVNTFGGGDDLAEQLTWQKKNRIFATESCSVTTNHSGINFNCCNFISTGTIFAINRFRN